MCVADDPLKKGVMLPEKSDIAQVHPLLCFIRRTSVVGPVY